MEFGYDVWDRAKLIKGRVGYDVTHSVDLNNGVEILMFVISHKELQQKAANERYFDKMDDF